MNFNEFVNEVKDNIKLFLPRDYENAEVSTMECHKLNRAYTGLMVRKEGEMLTPTINLNRLYEAYKAQPGVTMETVCRKIADIVIEAPIQVDLKAILNYEDVKDKLFIRVSSAEANKEVLEIVPHQLKEDLAITYHVAVGKNQDGLSSMLITNEMMKEYGVTQEQIHEDAMKSSPRVMVPEVSSIGVLIDEIYQKNILMLTPDEREMLLETLQESSEMPTFFVVTNTERIDGAGVIFYPEFMDNMGELLGNDFFILPSSIHQMLILPDDGQVDAEMLRDMVKEVNATQVAPAERLTNDVYHFDTTENYQIDGKKGNWIATDTIIINGKQFYLMEHQVYRDQAQGVILDAYGKMVVEECKKFDEKTKQKIHDYIQQQVPLNPIDQLKQDGKLRLEHYQKFYQNGTYERSRESGTEANYDMVDGLVNNQKKNPEKFLDARSNKQTPRNQQDVKPKKRRSVIKRLHQKQIAIARRSGKPIPKYLDQEMERKRG